jgi:hypothetical protein
MTLTKTTFKTGALLLVICLISTVMISGTFAKYTSVYAGQDTALVARWSFEAKGGDGDITLGATADNTELALFDHLYDTHINQKASDNATFIIAPGVSDQFTIKMNYIADVDADVLINFDPLTDNVSVPIEYSVDGGTTYVTLDNLAEALAVKIAATADDPMTDPTQNDETFRIAKVANDSITPVAISETIKWRWPYEASDQVYEDSTNETDTELGTDSNDAGLDRTSYGIKVTLTATQVLPTTE